MQAVTYQEALKTHYAQVREYGDYTTGDDYRLSTGAVSGAGLRAAARISLAEYRHRDRAERAAAYIVRRDSFSKARRIARAMSERLGAAGRDRLARKVGACFEHGRILVFETGQTFEPAEACGYAKLCPFHSRTEARRRLERYLKPVSETAQRARIQFGTLTVPNAPIGQYRNTADNLWAAWGRLRRQGLWSGVIAAMVNLETTWSNGEFNLHLHVLAAVRHGEDFNWGNIRAAWGELTGSQWVHFSPVRPEGVSMVPALKELVKYPAKFEGREPDLESPVDWDTQSGGGLLDMPQPAFEEWLAYSHGRRTMRTYGEWFSVPEEEGEEPDRGELLAEFRWSDRGAGLDVYLIRVHKSTLLTAWTSENLPTGSAGSGSDPP